MTANPVVFYYDIVLALSLVLTGIYIFNWHKHFDAHITLVFVLVPVICLGYSLMAHSSVREEALAVNKFIYLGGCFLQMIVPLVACSMCGIKLPRALKTLFFAVSTVIYVFILNPMQSGDYYRAAELVQEDGLAVLSKEYGWMHTVFEGMVVVYFLLGIAVLVYSFFRKKQISRKILLMLFIPEVLAVIAFFAGRKIAGRMDLLPVTYVTAQFVYLILVSRIALYDMTDNAIDSMVQNGDTGLISIDYSYHYLGSNETAKNVFPALRLLTVDFTIRRSRSFSETVIPWLEAYKADENRNIQRYEKDDSIYEIKITPLFNNQRKEGYELTITDDTPNQRYIKLISRYNDQLNDEVAEKTAHLEEMHDKLILGLATMVESRDNSTGGHIRRTSEGVRILLGEMEDSLFPELTEDFRKKLIKAAPMHDLGKIAVDDEVLRKPGRFTPEEFEKMKAHAAEGARIVHEILRGTDDVEFHHIAENVAHYHHERWDGSGYPEGLKGEEIPLEARIMAVADVYDALVSKRVYKERMSPEKADEIMMGGMGTQFAPEMKDVYCRAREKLESYYDGQEQ